jgi:hypothetical protein
MNGKRLVWEAPLFWLLDQLSRYSIKDVSLYRCHAAIPNENFNPVNGLHYSHYSSVPSHVREITGYYANRVVTCQSRLDMEKSPQEADGKVVYPFKFIQGTKGLEDGLLDFAMTLAWGADLRRFCANSVKSRAALTDM